MTGDATGGADAGAAVTTDPAGPSRDTADPADVAGQVAALRRDLDTLLPHVVRALTRDEAHAALIARLDDAERRLQARSGQPLALALARLLWDVRRFDRRDMTAAGAHLTYVEDELSAILRRHGLEEFGEPGEAFDQERHRPVAGVVGADGGAVVAEVVTPGLAFGDDVVVRAVVHVRPADDQET